MRVALVILSGIAWLSPVAVQVRAAPMSATVDQPLRAGESLDSALAALNARGHRIVYSSALVTPAMTLREAPTFTRIDDLLAEILAPWRLRAAPAENGDWLIVAAGSEPRASAVEIGAPAEPVELQVVDVTTSRYALATPGSSSTFLDRRGVEQMPHLADDAVRMLKVLPGVSGGDFSAALNIRGGRREETLLRIDGAEIHNGFHFRDLTGALSVLDTTLVDNIDFVTGGMTVRHGDALSGLVDMRTRRPRAADEYQSAAGVSFVSAYARTGGAFAQGRGAWLVSARRGYLDLVMERVQQDDEQITPRYTDVFASVFHDFSPDTTITAHALLGEDDLRLVSNENDDIDSAGQGRAGHVWLTFDHRLGALQASTVVSTSSVRQWRKASGSEEYRTGDVDADFRFRFLDLRTDWTWDLSARQVLLFGANAERSRARYEYALLGDRISRTVPGARDLIDYSHDLDLRGTKVGAHAAWRGRVGDLVVEAGTRWDEYRYPHDLRFSAVSPRINALYGLGERGELRAAVSVAHQPQGLDELQVEDDVATLFAPERVRQVVLGYLHRFDHGLSARLDVYRKDYSQLRARFENALDPVQLIPEGSIDRVRIEAPRARARGVELTVRREAERGLAGWASFAVASAEDETADDGWVPRLWDQRRAVSLGLSWSGAKWNLNLAGLHHSGTPTTRLRQTFVTLPGGERLDVVVPGARNAERLGQYARLDLRATRTVQLRSARLSYYLEATNLLNRANPCCIEAWHLRPDGSGGVRLVIEETDWLPLLPSFGFEFEF